MNGSRLLAALIVAWGGVLGACSGVDIGSDAGAKATSDGAASVDQAQAPTSEVEALAGSSTPGWIEAAPGFETAEFDMVMDGEVIDRAIVSRVDPNRFVFSVASRPESDRTAEDWLVATGAALVANGSFFGAAGEPVTPIVAGGEPGGPSSYDATHGAFVAYSSGPHAGEVAVVDLAGKQWTEVFDGAEAAMVSFPLLVDDDGRGRVSPTDSGLPARRTFIGEDAAGWIVIGTTVDRRFSLADLSAYLLDSPLDLVTALNLDGGPIACQAIRLGSVDFQNCGIVPGVKLPLVVLATPR